MGILCAPAVNANQSFKARQQAVLIAEGSPLIDELVDALAATDHHLGNTLFIDMGNDDITDFFAGIGKESMPLHANRLLAIIFSWGHVLYNVRFIAVDQEHLQKGHKPLSSQGGVMDNLITDKEKDLVFAVAYHRKNDCCDLLLSTVKNAEFQNF